MQKLLDQERRKLKEAKFVINYILKERKEKLIPKNFLFMKNNTMKTISDFETGETSFHQKKKFFLFKKMNSEKLLNKKILNIKSKNNVEEAKSEDSPRLKKKKRGKKDKITFGGVNIQDNSKAKQLIVENFIEERKKINKLENEINFPNEAHKFALDANIDVKLIFDEIIVFFIKFLLNI